MTREEMKEKSSFRVFLSYYRPHKKIFAADLLCALGGALIDLVFPLATRYSLQHLLPNNLFMSFFTIMAAMILLQLIRAGFTYVVAYLGHMAGIRFEADIRQDLFDHMQSLSFDFFDHNRTGQLMNRVTGDLFEISELSHHGPENILSSAAVLLGGLIIMFQIQWKLALVILCIFPIVVAITLLLRKRMSRASKLVKERLSGINNEIESSISGMRTAKAFASEEKEREKFHKSNRLYVNSKGEFHQAMGLFSGSQEFFMSFIHIAVILVGGILILSDQFDAVNMITFTLYISAFLTPIRQITVLMEQLAAGTAGFSRFLELMRTEADIKDKPDAVSIGHARGEIQFDHVSFSYDGETSVLKDINLLIPPGETLAVVGPSGGGKSTLCQLIPRFYEASSGRVLVDGMDVREVTQHSLRQNIGIVQQDVFLFADSVLENIRYGNLDASMEAVIEAAKQAEIHEDIMAMPNGYDTYVGERGTMLSGGQKQRVAIARIFLKNPPILILDEATSALDSVTEARIQAAFDALSKGRTTLIIAHRLSTIRSAQEIIVVEDDGIAEQGSHDALMAQDGIYAHLYRTQSGAV